MSAEAAGARPRRVAITGATGLIGRALARHLGARGDEVRRVLRAQGSGEPNARDIGWEPSRDRADPRAFEGIDAVVHLAGEPIAQRWNDDVKQRIRDSRVGGTRLLAETLAAAPTKPEVLVTASAVGIYGDRGEERLDESSLPGDDFLARVGMEWERASAPAAAAGIRVVHTRFGIVLSPEGGALGRLLLPFKLGVGGPIGSGDQWMSWVTLEDAVRAIAFVLDTRSVRGAVNVVAPEPVRNREFAATLGRVLHRPAVLPVPGFALRAVYRGMADATLLASQRVYPTRLQSLGFEFRSRQLKAALERVLNPT